MFKPMMRAARLHEPGGQFQVDEVPMPQVRDTDVIVQVKASGVIPNLPNVIHHFAQWFPSLPMAELPATYGLDSAGVVVAVGERVRQDIKPGDRVYVNPGLSCGSCTACRAGQDVNCSAYTFMGYFGFGPGSVDMFKDYPYGGFGEFLTAPARNLVKLPDNVSYEAAARFGYIGTAYSGLRKANLQAGQTVMIDGGTGTLGVGATICALAMGAAKIFVTGRNTDLLARLKSVAPNRIHALVAGEGVVEEILQNTHGLGVDVIIQCLGANAPAKSVVTSIKALRRGGIYVNTGGLFEPLPIDTVDLMTHQKSILGSLWFTTAEGQAMADMAEAGVLNLQVFERQSYSIEKVDEALAALEVRDGGFTNIVIVH
ncbi:alcohol dehydrogenase catalytic domain-containing protein [Pseudomonas baetica]|uniref:alcohol dehydrogenase catalytic domain-containing protein n=1 Tax=Pseudomonas baetica TaxID=674054 RepID=UPI003EE838FD